MLSSYSHHYLRVMISKKMYKAGLIICLAISIHVFYAKNILHHYMMFGDSAAYVNQAESFVNGTIDEYFTAHRFMMEHSTPIGPLAYPWGTSVLLSIPYVIWGQNIIAYKAVSVITTTIMLAGFGWYAYKRLGFTTLILLVAMGVHPAIIQSTNILYSDAIFMSVVVLCVAGCHTLIEQRSLSRNESILRGASIGLLCALPIFFRLNGVILACALVCTLAILAVPELQNASSRKRLFQAHWPAALTGAVAFLICIAVWHLWLPGVGKLPSHRPWPLSISNIARSITYYAKLMDDVWSVANVTYAIPTAVTAWMLVAIGAWKHKWQHVLPIVFSVLSLCLLLILDMKSHVRYLLFFIPFLIYFGLLGTQALYQWLNERSGRMGLIVWILPIVITAHWAVTSSAKFYNGGIRLYFANSAPATEAYTFIEQHTSENAIIGFYKPRSMYLFTDRRSIWASYEKTKKQAHYIIATEHMPHYVPKKRYEDMLRDAPNELEPVFDNDYYQIYRNPYVTIE